MRALAAALAVALGASAAEVRETSFQSVPVHPGDTLWSISHKWLKDPTRWDEILKHNRLPTQDPTVALPGMTLRVPVQLIKTQLRAANLAYAVNRVLFRRKDTAEWKPGKIAMELFRGDSLRTLEDSKARVKLLDKELLSLDPNSMAVIKPDDSEGDVELKAGAIFAGRARVVTAHASVTPRTKDTRYSARVEPDLTTRVEVYTGQAQVEAQGSKVIVPAGMGTRVQPGLAPEVPRKVENMPELESRALEFSSAEAAGGGAAAVVRAATEPPPQPEADADQLRADLSSLRVGTPILGYHVQASRDRDFAKLVVDKKYDADERFRPADEGLAPGAYWWRVAIVDLLGSEGRFSEPRYYSVGLKVVRSADVDLRKAVTIASPAEDATYTSDTVQVVGIIRDDRVHVEVSGRPVRADADGNFVVTVPLVVGPNELSIAISNEKGDQTRFARRVTRR